ncbi:hypothetical protein [Burkholderia sp. ISTR5]|uniref:hypothetical protein n=1 Tax=Burkholderia sp. ISTR5 TaxID=2500161 RepID=UPI00136D94B9|nr:hypothetical protein [Burkholderia sp. ISTR5]NBI46454.1 hypothetical protein [Burkholderia sp. ISTR5]
MSLDRKDCLQAGPVETGTPSHRIDAATASMPAPHRCDAARGIARHGWPRHNRDHMLFDMAAAPLTGGFNPGFGAGTARRGHGTERNGTARHGTARNGTER